MEDVAIWIQSGEKDFRWSSRPESRKEIVIESVTGREAYLAYLEMRCKLFYSKLSWKKF